MLRSSPVVFNASISRRREPIEDRTVRTLPSALSMLPPATDSEWDRSALAAVPNAGVFKAVIRSLRVVKMLWFAGAAIPKLSPLLGVPLTVTCCPSKLIGWPVV